MNEQLRIFRWRRRGMLAGLTAWALPARAQPAPAPTDMVPALIDYLATSLTRLIKTARQETIADGVRPIPPAVYRALLGYFPAALLGRTRFATGKAGALTLPALAFSYGDPVAIALGDVVVFRSERLAQSDLRLWAHELTHVMQYQRWGIDGFADHYVRDSAAVEQEATDNADRFMAWLPHRGNRPAG